MNKVMLLVDAFVSKCTIYFKNTQAYVSKYVKFKKAIKDTITVIEDKSETEKFTAFLDTVNDVKAEVKPDYAKMLNEWVNFRKLPKRKPQIIEVCPMSNLAEVDSLFNDQGIGTFYTPQLATEIKVGDKAYYSTLTGYIYNTLKAGRLDVGIIKSIKKDKINNLACKVQRKEIIHGNQ